MNKNNLVLKIADIFLESEKNSVDWKRDTKLLNSWYFFFVSILLLFSYSMIFMSIFSTQIESSKILTLVSRLIRIGFTSILIGSLYYMTYSFYVFAIENKNKIYLINIVYFFLLNIIIFGKLYAGLYITNPDFFKTSIELPPYSETMISYGLKSYLIEYKFFLYSAFQSVTGNFSLINSNSYIISIFNLIQNVYSISLISILISTFVNRNK